MRASLLLLTAALLGSALPAWAQGRPTAKDPSVPLAWNYTPPAPDTFVVQRRPGDTTSMEEWVTVATVPGTETTWEDLDAVPGVAYCWQVRAVMIDSGTSSPTNLYCVQVAATTPAPTDLRGTVKRYKADETRPERP